MSGELYQPLPAEWHWKGNPIKLCAFVMHSTGSSKGLCDLPDLQIILSTTPHPVIDWSA